MNAQLPDILFLYNHPFQKNASTIFEHINAFAKYSKYHIWYVNTETGFPRELRSIEFKVIVLHYSLAGTYPFSINPRFLNYLSQCRNSYKIAFFQDEFTCCQERFSLINKYQIDCVFTLVEPEFFGKTYQKYTSVSRLVYNIPGYVDDDLIEKAKNHTIPDEERAIDIGYRGRPLPYYAGMGGQEKTEIADRFSELSKGLGFNLDIETRENKRIYQKDWHRFVASCKAMLGVESGVSIFDLDNSILDGYQRIIEENPKIRFFEVSEKLNFKKYENNIPYRTISPRNFEAAAFKVCQILYEGNYSGILKPMVHYIPLKKDFSNFDDVIQKFRDPAIRRMITENAYRDLIASGRYSYQAFINKKFDQVLIDAGIEPITDQSQIHQVTNLLRKGEKLRWVVGSIKGILLSLPRPMRRWLNNTKKRIIQTFHPQ